MINLKKKANFIEFPSDRACAEKAFEYLYKEVGPKIVTDSLKKDIDKVVGAMVLRLWDPMDGKYAKYMRYVYKEIKETVKTTK